MARKKQNHALKNSSPQQPHGFRPGEFEEIELPTKSPHAKAPQQEFEHIYPEMASLGIHPLREHMLSAKNKLEQQLLLQVSEQALSAESGTNLCGFENIVGVGMSQKMVNNRFTSVSCITVYVVAKEAKDKIHPHALVPEKVNGIPTDVVQTGEFHALPYRGLYRPAPGGVSIGHYQITAGTLACLVRRGSALYILSNNHVLANSNKGLVGDPILQPGPFDGGQIPAHVIAQLSEFVPVQFGGAVNQVDCAIAQTSPTLVTSNNICFGRISATPASCFRFQIVKKCGRTTQDTVGLVTDCDATIRVGYGNLGTAIFRDQIIIAGVPFIFPFSGPGDSGSLILDQFSNQPVGLLFAGNFLFTIANKIGAVLSKLNVSIVA